MGKRLVAEGRSYEGRLLVPPLSQEIVIVQTLYRSLALIASSFNPMGAKHIRDTLGCKSNAVWSTVSELLEYQSSVNVIGSGRWRKFSFRG